MVTSHDKHFWNALENHDEEIISIFKAIETDCRTNVFVSTRDHAAAKDCFRAPQMGEASGVNMKRALPMVTAKPQAVPTGLSSTSAVASSIACLMLFGGITRLRRLK